MNIDLEERIRQTLRMVAGSAPTPDTVEVIHEWSEAAIAVRRRPRRLGFALVSVLFVAVLCGAVWFARTRSPGQAVGVHGEEKFSLNVTPFVIAPGQELVVSGSGCPASGPLSTPSDPVFVRLIPPSGGNDFGPLVDNKRVDIVTNQMYVPGEAEAQATPSDDGTFAAVVRVPDDAPLGPGYSVTGICATLIRLGDAPDGIDPASMAAATTTISGPTVR